MDVYFSSLFNFLSHSCLTRCQNLYILSSDLTICHQWAVCAVSPLITEIVSFCPPQCYKTYQLPITMTSSVSKDVQIYFSHMLTLLQGSWLPINTWIYVERIYTCNSLVVTLGNLKYLYAVPIDFYCLLNCIHCRFITILRGQKNQLCYWVVLEGLFFAGEGYTLYIV